VIDVAGPAAISGSLVSLANGSIGTTPAGPPIPGSGTSLIGVRGALTTAQAPLVVVDGGTDALIGVQRVLSVEPTGSLALGGSALSLVNGNAAAGTILGFAAPVNTPTTAAAVAVSGGTLLASDALLSATANLGVGGGLLAQSGGSVVTIGAAVASITGATFASLPAAVFQLTGGSLSALGPGGGNLLRASAATVNLGGALLDSQNAAVSLAGAVAFLTNGSHLIQGGAPLARIQGGSLQAGALLGTDGNANTFAFNGTVLDLTNTTAHLGAIAVFQDLGTDTVTLTLGPGEPAARVTRSTLTIAQDAFVILGGDVMGCSPCPGVALISTGTATSPSSITVADELVGLGNIDFIGSTPIVQLTRTLVPQTGDGSPLISWFADGTLGTRSTTKPLLMANDSTLDLQGRTVFEFGNTHLNISGGAPFLGFGNSVVNAGWLAEILSGELDLDGPLAAFTGGNSTIGGALLRIMGGGAVVTSAAPPMVGITGGTHQFGWVFQLDNANVTENQVVTGFGASPDMTLRLGTTQPLRRASGALQAPLLSASNATIDAATGLRLDTVRLDTLSRLFDFTDSTVTGGSLGFIDLARSARLVAAIPDGGLVNLVHSSMTLSGNALARVRGAPQTGGSLLQIGTPTAASSLVSLAGGSTLTLLTNAALLSVTDGSAAQIFGSLISFVGTGSTVTVDNNLCLAFICSTVNGVKIARGASVLLSSIRIETDPISGLALNTLTVDADDALILIDGADSRLLIAATGPDEPEVVLTETAVSDVTLKTFSRTSSRPGVSPVILITDSIVDAPNNALVIVESGANATLQAGPLMKITGGVTDSDINALRLLLVQGTLNSFGSSPLIALDPVTVNAETLVEVAAEGNLSLAGPLLTDLNGKISTKHDAFLIVGSLSGTGLAPLVGLQGTNFNITPGSRRSLFEVTGNVSLKGALLDTTDAHVTVDGVGVLVDGGKVEVVGSAAPLIRLTGTGAQGTSSTVTTGDQLVRLQTAAASTLALSGPLLEAVGTTIKTGDPTRNTAGLVAVHDGAHLTSTAGAPLISLDHTTADLGGGVLGVRKSPSAQLPSAVTLFDRVLRAEDSVVTTTTTGFDAMFGTTFHGNCCSVLSVQQGALLVTKNDVPLFELIGSELRAGPDQESGGSIFNVRDTLNGAPATGPTAELIAAATATLAGQVLVARRSASTPSIVSALGDFIQVWRSTLTSATTKPLIDLEDGTQLTLGGDNPLTDPPTPTGGRLLDVTAGITNTVNGKVGPGTAQVSLAGPLLGAVNATIVARDDLVGLFDGAKLESKTTDPFVSISGGSVKLGTAGSFFTMTSAAGQAAATATLQGPLLNATGTTLQNGTPDVLSSGSTNFVALADGAILTTTLGMTEPLVSLANAKIDSAGNFFDIRRGASVTLHGPLLVANDSTVDTTSLGFGTSNCCHGVRLGQGGSLTGMGSAALIQLTRSTFNAGPDAQSGGLVIRLVDVGTVATDVASASTMTLAGPLLTSTDSFVTALNSFMTVDRSKFKATTPEPLILISGTGPGDLSMRLGGPNPFSTPTPNAEIFSRLLTVFGGSTTSPGPVPPADSSVSLVGPLLSASGATLSMTGDVIGVGNGATLESSTDKALITLKSDALNRGTSLKAGSISAGFSGDILEVGGVGGTNTTPGSVTLHGPLLAVSGSSNVELTGRLVNIFDGGQVTVQRTTAPLVSLTGGLHQLSTPTTVNTSQFSVSSGTAGIPPSSLTLSGPLFSATQTTITLGSQTANPAGTTTSGMMFVGDSSTLVSQTADALFSFDRTTYTGPNLMSVRRSRDGSPPPTTVTLAGPWFEATGSTFNLGSGGNAPNAVCCTPFFVSQGAHLSATTEGALIQLSATTFDNRDPVRSGSDFFAVTNTFGSAPAGESSEPAVVELHAGPGGGLLSSTDSSIETLSQLVNIVRSNLKSTGLAPLIDLTGSSVVMGGPNPFAATPGTINSGRVVNLVGSTGLLDIAGRLVQSVNTTIDPTDDFVGMFDGATLKSTTASSLISISGGGSQGPVGRPFSVTLGAAGSFLNMTSAAGQPGTAATLQGALLEATNTTLRTGTPSELGAGTPQFLFFADGASFTRTTPAGTTPQALVSLMNSTIDSAGSFIGVVRKATVTIDGSLLSAVDSTIDVTSKGGAPGVCCNALRTAQGGVLKGTGTAPFIQLTRSIFNAGPDAQSGANFIRNTDAGFVAADVPSPSTIALASPLLVSTNSQFSALAHFLNVERSTFSSTTADYLIQLNGQLNVALPPPALLLGGLDPLANVTQIGRLLTVNSSATSGAVGDAARVSLTGPLLSAVSAPVQLNSDVVDVFNGAKVDSTSTSPFIQLDATALTTANPTQETRLATVAGVGGPDGVTPATLTLSGPFLRAVNGSVVETNAKGLSLFTDGALVTRVSPAGTYSLIVVDGTKTELRIGGTSSGRLFDITGAASPQQPLQHNGGGALLEASNGAFVNIRGANGVVLRLDTATLEASAPVFILAGMNTVLQTSGHGIDLANNALLNNTKPSEALVRIDSQASMNIPTGHLVNVAATSRLTVAGDLVRLGSGATLNVGSATFNGVLLNVVGGGIANIGGALVAFTGNVGSGAAIRVTNNLAPTTFIGGIPVSAALGANIVIGQGALAGLNVNGTILINNVPLPTAATAATAPGITGSLISVGANGTVNIVGRPN
jgi:hypothetical protein